MTMKLGLVSVLFITVVAAAQQTQQNPKIGLEPLAQTRVDPTDAKVCISEVNAGTEIDLACVIPENALYTVELFVKEGYDTPPWKWTQCETSGLFRCGSFPAGWWGVGVLKEEPGKKAIQGRIVRDNPGVACRARLKVTYVTK